MKELAGVNDVTIQKCDVCINPDYSPYIVIIPNKTIIFLTNLMDLIESSSPKVVSVPTVSQPTCCCFSPDGRHFAVGFENGLLTVNIGLEFTIIFLFIGVY